MPPSSDHRVKSFEQELKRLSGLLTAMGGMVESQVSLAEGAIMRRDADAALRTIAADPLVDDLERDVERSVVQMLALRQPMAGDLRHIVAALKISADLERIGDYATNIAKRSMVLNQFSVPFRLAGLGHMIHLVQVNLKLIVDAIGEDDAEKALQVWRSDRPIDEVYDAIFRELITHMMEDPRSITPCTHLLFIAKNLERIGDHATNIAETLHYAVKGEVLSDARPKGDNSAYTIAQPLA